MLWAFIDYENIGKLGKVNLSIYERLIIFIGEGQSKLDFGDKKYELPINLTVIQVKGVQKNNADFHLAFYLGKFSEEANRDVTFDIISNDNGFKHLVSHINHLGRCCKQITINPTDVRLIPKPVQTKKSGVGEFIDKFKSKPVRTRPRTLRSLKNYIMAQMNGDNEVMVKNLLGHLVDHKVIASANEDKIQYI